jgi:hypothetical protein
MNTIKDGGPAFPLATDGGHFCEGMALRDYMAIHASEADILNQGEVIRSAQVRSYGIGVLPDGWRITARYMHADAMIRAREVTE